MYTVHCSLTNMHRAGAVPAAEHHSLLIKVCIDLLAVMLLLIAPNFSFQPYLLTSIPGLGCSKLG